MDPKDNFKLFKIEDICKLAENFYPQDFNEQERIFLKCQLQHYEIDIPKHQDFQGITILSRLCQRLIET